MRSFKLTQHRVYIISSHTAAQTIHSMCLLALQAVGRLKSMQQEMLDVCIASYAVRVTASNLNETSFHGQAGGS